MPYADVGYPADVLAAVRVTIIEPADGLAAVEQALWRVGALVQRISPDAVKSSRLAEPDIVIIRIDSNGRGGIPSGQLEAVRSLGPLPRVVALVDEPLVPVPIEIADFVVAPFSPEEVVARVARLPVGRPGSGSIRLGNLTLEPGSRTVLIKGSQIETTFCEFEILRSLLAANGRVLTRGEIAEQIGCAKTGRAVDIHVHRLRSKLGDLGDARIETVRGVGYRLRRTP